MKSAPQSTGRPGGLSLNDGLMNVATGMGTSRDRSTYNRWGFGGGLGGDLSCAPLDPAQIDAAYLKSWMVRKVHDLPAKEMTKAWRTWDLKPDEITKVEAEEKRLGVRDKYREGLRLGALQGGAAIIMGLPGNPTSPAPAAVTERAIKYLFVVTRRNLTFGEMDWDLGSPSFGTPKMFDLTIGAAASQVHPSRVIIFPGEPCPEGPSTNDEDRLWGRPLLESLNEAIQDATVGQRASANMLTEATTDVIGIPGLTDMVSTQDGEAMLANRLRVAQLMRSMFQAILLDSGKGEKGEGETWETRQLSFAGLPDVGRFLLQIVAGARDIPLTRFIGSPPEGMNATGEHDEENFLSMIRSEQDRQLRPKMERLDPFLLGSAGVKVDTADTWTFSPLAIPTPMEQAEIDDLKADTLNTLKLTGLFQTDALAKTAVQVLGESPTFTSLGENIAASSEPIPATQEAEQAANMGEAKVRSLMTPAGPKKLIKRTKDALMFDARPMTLYISRQVRNPQELLNHYRKQGLDIDLTAAGDLHVTQMYCEEPVDWMKLPMDWSAGADGLLRLPPGGPRVMELFGPLQDVLVLSFQANELQWRNEALKREGIESKWPDYQPHITLAKVSPDFDLATVAPYTGRIVLGPEIFEEVK